MQPQNLCCPAAVAVACLRKRLGAASAYRAGGFDRRRPCGNGRRPCGDGCRLCGSLCPEFCGPVPACPHRVRACPHCVRSPVARTRLAVAFSFSFYFAFKGFIYIYSGDFFLLALFFCFNSFEHCSNLVFNIFKNAQNACIHRPFRKWLS